MDWNAAIDKHREALKRVVATLAAMAGLWDRQSAIGSGQSGEAPADGIPDCLLPTADCLFLPRHLHRAVLRLLRPAEAAARRLVIVAARGIELPPPPPRFTRSPSPASQGRNLGRGRPQRGSSPVGGMDGLSAVAQRAKAEGGGMAPPYPTRIAFPLFDPPRCLPHKRLRASATAMPRISIPGYTVPAPLPVPPAPGDEIDARRLTLRLTALARALDDLPREARRFARWRAKGADAAGTQNRERGADAAGAQTRNPDAGRMRRIWPLRSGRPPGQRPAKSRRPVHAVHRILEDIHGLAFWALEAPDTS